MNLFKAALLSSVPLFASQLAVAEKEVDCASLRIINQGYSDCTRTFTRLPSRHQNNCNPTVWNNANHSAGIAVRFATDSRTLGVKYSLWANTHMNHQAPTGTKGVDLYILDDGKQWRHVNTIRPADQRSQSGSFNVNMDGTVHEFMMYLPTYDGVDEMTLLVDDNATVTRGNYDAIDAGKRIVFYGTSILQGGCVSRPGMVATSILSRMLNAECINMGFSGGARMEYYFANALGDIDNVAAYVIDPIPNCDDEASANVYTFVKTLRNHKPDVPVFLVEGPIYPYAKHNSYFNEYLPKKNAIFREGYEKLIAEGDKNLYYIDSYNLDGEEDDGTVDGIHLTDLGFKYYAAKLYDYLEPFTGTALMTITSPGEGQQATSLNPVIVWSRSDRQGTVEVATRPTFGRTEMVYTGTGTGSHEIPENILGGSTTYYVRVGYTTQGSDAVSYTPTVSFTTVDAVPRVPGFVTPQHQGILYRDQKIAFEPCTGATSLRLEVSSSTSFPSRTSYISSNITGPEWTDGKTASEIRLGGSALVNGNTYYARVRAAYNTATGSSNTEWSDVISFTYSTEAGVGEIKGDQADTTPITYTVDGRRIDNPTPGQATITVTSGNTTKNFK